MDLLIDFIEHHKWVARTSETTEISLFAILLGIDTNGNNALTHQARHISSTIIRI